MTEKKSTKSQSNDSNITPVRSEAMLNNPRGNIGGGSRLLLFFLGFINLIGLFVLGLWFFNTSYYQQQTGQGFVERISFLEENVAKNSQVNEESLDSIELEYKFLEKEIRKLWDVSNKKNRKNIEENSFQINEISTSIDDFTQVTNTLSAKQRAADLELAKIDKAYVDLKQKFKKINALASKSTLEERIKIQEEAMLSLDSYRKQINKSLLLLQERIDALEIKNFDSSED